MVDETSPTPEFGPTVDLSTGEKVVTTIPLETLPPPPSHVGAYAIQKRIGMGGMAEVFLASGPDKAMIPSTVVVKRCLPHLAIHEKFTELFLRESRVLANISHPGIIRVYDTGIDGAPYMVMEYIDGMSVRELGRRAWAAKRSVPMEVALAVIADAAAALHFAYSDLNENGQPRRIIHRDISPDNIMLTRAGQTKVLDFGLAKGADDIDLTATGELTGKMAFVPPERLNGDEVDTRADIYALGITLYWLLCGRRPYQGSAMVLMQNILNTEPSPPSAFNPVVPKQIDDLVMSMIAKDPEKRPANGQVLVDALSPVTKIGRTLAAEFMGEIVHLETSGRFYQNGKPVDENSEEVVLTVLAAAPVTSQIMEAFALPKVSSTPLKPAEQSAVPLESEDTLPTASSSLPEPVSQITSDLIDFKPSRAPLVALAGAGMAICIFVGAYFAFNPSTNEASDSQLPVAMAVDKPAPLPIGATGFVPAEKKPPSEIGPNRKPHKEHMKGLKARQIGQKPERSRPSSAQRATRNTKGKTTSSSIHPNAPTKVSIATKGPRRLHWLDLKNHKLGQGKTSLDIDSNIKWLWAKDPRRGVKVKIRVRNGVANYGDAKKGTLRVLTAPAAEEVWLGNENLGQAPLPPIRLVAGTYKLKLLQGGKTVRRTVTVSADAEARIKVRF